MWHTIHKENGYISYIQYDVQDHETLNIVHIYVHHKIQTISAAENSTGSRKETIQSAKPYLREHLKDGEKRKKEQ
jgi:hypothetical protein